MGQIQTSLMWGMVPQNYYIPYQTEFKPHEIDPTNEKVDKFGRSILELYFYNTKVVDINHVKSLLSEWILTKVDTGNRGVLANYIISRERNNKYGIDIEIVKLLRSEKTLTALDKKENSIFFNYILQKKRKVNADILELLFHQNLLEMTFKSGKSILLKYLSSLDNINVEININILKMLNAPGLLMKTDDDGEYPLNFYIKKHGNNTEIMEMLSTPQLLTKLDVRGNYPLKVFLKYGKISKICKNNIEIVKILSHPDLLTKVDNRGMFPLKLYISNGGKDYEIIKILYHQDLETKSDLFGNHLLKSYIKKYGNDDIRVVEMLINKDALEKIDSFENYILKIYIKKGGDDPRIIEMLSTPYLLTYIDSSEDYPLKLYIKKCGNDPRIIELLSHPDLPKDNLLKLYIENGGNNDAVVEMLTKDKKIDHTMLMNYIVYRVYRDRCINIKIVKLLISEMALTVLCCNDYSLFEYYFLNAGENLDNDVLKLLFHPFLLTKVDRYGSKVIENYLFRSKTLINVEIFKMLFEKDDKYRLFEKYVYTKKHVVLEIAEMLIPQEIEEGELFERYVDNSKDNINISILKLLFKESMLKTLDNQGRSFFERYITKYKNKPINDRIAQMLYYDELKDKGHFILENYINDNSNINLDIVKMLASKACITSVDEKGFLLAEKYISKNDLINNAVLELLIDESMIKKVDNQGRSLFEIYAIGGNKRCISKSILKMLFYPELKEHVDKQGLSLFEKYINYNGNIINLKAIELLFSKDLLSKVDSKGLTIYENYIINNKNIDINIEVVKVLYRSVSLINHIRMLDVYLNKQDCNKDILELLISEVDLRTYLKISNNIKIENIKLFCKYNKDSKLGQATLKVYLDKFDDADEANLKISTFLLTEKK